MDTSQISTKNILSSLGKSFLGPLSSLLMGQGVNIGSMGVDALINLLPALGIDPALVKMAQMAKPAISLAFGANPVNAAAGMAANPINLMMAGDIGPGGQIASAATGLAGMGIQAIPGLASMLGITGAAPIAGTSIGAGLGGGFAGGEAAMGGMGGLMGAISPALGVAATFAFPAMVLGEMIAGALEEPHKTKRDYFIEKMQADAMLRVSRLMREGYTPEEVFKMAQDNPNLYITPNANTPWGFAMYTKQEMEWMDQENKKIEANKAYATGVQQGLDPNILQQSYTYTPFDPDQADINDFRRWSNPKDWIDTVNYNSQRSDEQRRLVEEQMNSKGAYYGTNAAQFYEDPYVAATYLPQYLANAGLTLEDINMVKPEAPWKPPAQPTAGLGYAMTQEQMGDIQAQQAAWEQQYGNWAPDAKYNADLAKYNEDLAKYNDIQAKMAAAFGTGAQDTLNQARQILYYGSVKPTDVANRPIDFNATGATTPPAETTPTTPTTPTPTAPATTTTPTPTDSITNLVGANLQNYIDYSNQYTNQNPTQVAYEPGRVGVQRTVPHSNPLTAIENNLSNWTMFG